MLLPFRVILLSHPLVEHPEDFLCIADYVMVGMYILIDFRPVYIDMNDLCLHGECFRVQGHSVRESAAYCDKKIALVNCDV